MELMSKFLGTKLCNIARAAKPHTSNRKHSGDGFTSIGKGFSFQGKGPKGSQLPTV